MIQTWINFRENTTLWTMAHLCLDHWRMLQKISQVFRKCQFIWALKIDPPFLQHHLSLHYNLPLWLFSTTLTSFLEEPSSFSNIHGQVHPEVHILRPGLLHWHLTHHRENATVQVSLASCLVIPGHSNDGGTGAVSSHLVSRPETGWETGKRDH